MFYIKTEPTATGFDLIASFKNKDLEVRTSITKDAEMDTKAAQFLMMVWITDSGEYLKSIPSVEDDAPEEIASRS